VCPSFFFFDPLPGTVFRRILGVIRMESHNPPYTAEMECEHQTRGSAFAGGFLGQAPNAGKFFCAERSSCGAGRPPRWQRDAYLGFTVEVLWHRKTEGWRFFFCAFNSGLRHLAACGTKMTALWDVSAWVYRYTTSCKTPREFRAMAGGYRNKPRFCNGGPVCLRYNVAQSRALLA